MEFMQQCLDKPDLMEKVVKPLDLEEKHLVHLELMIMEQVADWELDSGKNEYGSRELCKIGRKSREQGHILFCNSVVS